MNRILYQFSIIGSIAFFSIYGCRRDNVLDNAESANKKIASPTTSAYEALSKDAVLIRVDGIEMSKGTFERFIDLKKKTMILKASPKAQLEAKDLSFVKDTMLNSLTNAFPREVAILRYASANGITPSEKEIESCRRGLMGNCGVSGKWENAAKRFTKEELNTAENRIYVEALQMAVKSDYLEKNRVIVPDQELAMLLERFSDYNRRCSLTNATIYATASNIYNRIEKESNFKELAEQFDEDEGRVPTGEWGEFTFQDFHDEPELARASRQFKPGYISPPLEADNGLMIVRVNEITDTLGDPNSPNYIPSPDAVFSLSRIFFHLPEFIEEPDRTQFRQQAQTAKDNADFIKFISDTASSYAVEYPSGVEIFEGANNKSHDEMTELYQ